MAIAETCPTCGLTDGMYLNTPVRCSDPWHADAHLRRKEAAIAIDREELARREEIAQLGRPRERAIDRDAVRISTIQARAETSRRHFEDALERFVSDYAPTSIHRRDEFQRDLMMLMRDAMQHQGDVYGMHIERTEMTLHQLSMISTSPLQAIYHPPKKKD